MNSRIDRFLVVVVLLVLCTNQHAARLSAQFQGAGWLVAYGGGSSLGGALGVTAAVVSPPAALNTPADAFADVADASSNGSHTLIVRRDGSVWAMGANDRGQLGLGYAGAPVETPTHVATLQDVVRVVVAGQSSYAIDSAGTLWVWGDDSFGQLGIGNPGNTAMQAAPVANTLHNVTDVDASEDFAVAATSDGEIWAWGSNASAQLGAAGPDRNTPQQVAAPAGFFAIDVAAGAQTVLARSFDREVMGWGSNSWGQLADAGDTIDAATTIVATEAIAMGAGDHHIVVARTDGTVQVRGGNWAGQLGNGWLLPSPGLHTVAGLSGVVDVAAGAAHSIAVTAGGEAYAWGFNHMRQLLLPTPDVFAATPQRVMDVPLTARFARARAATTVLLNDPGALAIRHSVPPAVACGEAFDASISIRGFLTSGGEPAQEFAGVQDLEMSLPLSPAFELAASPTADRGSVTISGGDIRWSMASLDASTATLRVSLRATGAEGEFALFNPISYVSSSAAAPTTVTGPVTFHPACPTPDVTPPVVSSVTPSITSISPPNNHMVPVTISVAATDDVSVAACSVTTVTSNEPADGDWAITGPLAVSLRAQRAGNGNGRTYRIFVACVDDAGNSTTGSTTVFVPKNKHH